LCTPSQPEVVLWRSDRCRVIDAAELAYPGYCRVVWNEHVREMTDLAPEQRAYLMQVIYGVEQSLRVLLQPTKINLAALGNQVPHLHWHVIPRFADDAHFPDAIWAPPRRPGAQHALDRDALRRGLNRQLAQ
jgi:diadenosine tetraphosphate (Ap4A) HIT family hydrolase